MDQQTFLALMRQDLEGRRLRDRMRVEELAQQRTNVGTSKGRGLSTSPTARGAGPAVPAVTLQRGGPAGEIIRLSATSVSLASGGADLANDTIVDQYGFSATTSAGAEWTYPRSGLHKHDLQFAWDSFEGGGTVELLVNGTVAATALDDGDGNGDKFDWYPTVKVAKGDTGKFRITQTSGSAQAATWKLTVSVQEPQRAIAQATWEKVASVDAWGIFNTGTSWWVTEGGGRTITEYDSSWVQQSTFESDVDTAVRGVTVLSGDVWITGDGEAGAGTDEKIWQYNTAGTLQSSFTTGPDTESNAGLATDGTDLWLIEASSAELRKYDTSGTLLDTVNLPGNRNGLAVYDGNLVLVNTIDSEIEVRNTSGTLLQTIGAYELDGPTGVWVAADGTLYVSKDGDGVYKWNEGTL